MARNRDKGKCAMANFLSSYVNLLSTEWNSRHKSKARDVLKYIRLLKFLLSWIEQTDEKRSGVNNCRLFLSSWNPWALLLCESQNFIRVLSHPLKKISPSERYGQTSTQELCNTSLQSVGLWNVQKKRARLHARVYISVTFRSLAPRSCHRPLLSRSPFSLHIKAELQKVCSEGSFPLGYPFDWRLPCQFVAGL